MLIRPAPVRAVMRANWIATAPNASLYEAERLMRLARVRQIPVEADGVLVGIVGYRDILRASLERLVREAVEPERTGLLCALPVASVMDSEPTTALPDDPIDAIALRMLERGVACVPVIEAGRMVGLLVESDLLRRAYSPSGAGIDLTGAMQGR